MFMSIYYVCGFFTIPSNGHTSLSTALVLQLTFPLCNMAHRVLFYCRLVLPSGDMIINYEDFPKYCNQ